MVASSRSRVWGGRRLREGAEIRQAVEDAAVGRLGAIRRHSSPSPRSHCSSHRPIARRTTRSSHRSPIDLQTQCKQAHWNVKGPHFIALHKLFDEVNEAVEKYVDAIAERARGRGRSSLPEYPVKTGDGRAHVEALSAVLSAFGKVVRAEINRSNELSDADTADLFTEVSRGFDKWLWFVEAPLQAER
jgi:starvation-inducible DNA-binding protein